MGLAAKLYLDQADIDKILSNLQVVEAKIHDVKEMSRLKKGVEIKQYSVLYSFMHDGTQYAGRADMAMEALERFKGEDAIAVIFNKSKPGQARI